MFIRRSLGRLIVIENVSFQELRDTFQCIWDMARVGLAINDEDWAAFAVGGWTDNMRDRMAEAVGDWEEDRWDRRTISGEKDIRNTWPIPAPQIIWRDLRQEAARMRAPALLYDQEQGAKVLFTVWIMLATWIDRRRRSVAKIIQQ